MGDPKRPRKKYETPRNPWQEERLKEELRLVGEYGLRNKRELWRAASTLRKYRNIARSLFILTGEERRVKERALIDKLYAMGLASSEADANYVLQLSVRDILERRLQTQVYRLGLAKTPYHARQLISHRKVSVGDRVISSPGYLVKRGEEYKIRLILPAQTRA
ncbi:MAG: 30S ribosomal protein S4 [Aigarchaeota archaeon]|nr:30S ribosomal protein S4 [Candidatus Calditenuaceae archaeon]